MLKLKLFRHNSYLNKYLLRNAQKSWQKSGYSLLRKCPFWNKFAFTYIGIWTLFLVFVKQYTDPFLWNNNFRVSVWQISGYLGLGGQIICSTLIVCHALFSDKEDYQKTFLQCIQSVFMKIHNFSFWHVMKITILTSSGMACLNDKLTHYL